MANITNPTHDDIARHAYVRYLANGARDGHDLDDWLEAERELRAAPIAGPREESIATAQYESADLEERTPG